MHIALVIHLNRCHCGARQVHFGTIAELKTPDSSLFSSFSAFIIVQQ